MDEAEFKTQMRYLRHAFSSPFWDVPGGGITEAIHALTEMVEGFDARLRVIERHLDTSSQITIDEK
jgi:hypothetical protein